MRIVKSGDKSFVVYSQDEARPCQLCKVRAVVRLDESQLARQTDGTTHVCHPGFGGCNYGFAEVVE